MLGKQDMFLLNWLCLGESGSLHLQGQWLPTCERQRVSIPLTNVVRSVLYGSTPARTFSISALFNLRPTVFNVGLVWNTESKKSDAVPGC